MKRILRGLRIGQILQAQIEEAIDTNDFLVSFEGDLLRVRNETGQAFNLGDAVELVVKSLRPLQFQLQPNRFERRCAGKLDVSV